MRAAAILFVFLLSAFSSYAYVIKGTVKDLAGNALGYANIYINGTTNGTSANAQGEYQLELKAGSYELVFQHLGFKTHVEVVNITGDKVLNVVLQTSQYEIRDVVINGNEDPAYAVIRKAIAKRKYFLDVVESYSCEAYVKGMQRLLNVPGWAEKRIKKAGYTVGDKGILYLSESMSKLYYKKPNKFKEEVYSSKVSGNSNGFTFNSAQDFYFNFYERSITIPVIATRPFISPLSESAFNYYKFKMLGAYIEGGRLVNKIQVIPKSKSGPCFSGVLSIVEDNWNIHSLELYLVKDNGIEYVDSLKITQYFVPVKDDIWLPTQQRYDVKASFMGVKGDGYYLGIFKNYQVNNNFGIAPPKIDSTKIKKPAAVAKKVQAAQKKTEQKIFTAESIKIDEVANKRDTLYWDSIRPVPLTELEAIDYTIKDSIEVIKETKAYKDSTDKEINKPSFMGIVLGYTYVKRYKRISVQLPSLLNLVNYNTVEGLVLQFEMTIAKNFSKGSNRGGRRLSFEPTFRYGFANRQFNAMGRFVYRNSQIHDEVITLSGGRFVSQFNEEQPQPEFGNTWKSLVLKINELKLYQQYFVKATYQREVYNGITMRIGANYVMRYPLENMSHVFIFKSVKRDYTHNGMDLPTTDYTNYNITRHNSLRFDLQLRFRFRQTYVTRPDVRFRTPDERMPQLVLIYKKAVPIKGGVSDLNYDYLEGRIEGKIQAKQLGALHYRIGGGGYPNAKAIQFSDYKHFYGRFLNAGETDMLGFYTIGFYRHSTKEYFGEAHLEHHFGGVVFDRIPGFNKLKWKEVLGFHALYTPVRKQYLQMDIGIENIFKVLRVDFVMGFGSGKKEYYYGARLGTTIGLR